MKKLLVVLGLLALMPGMAFPQAVAGDYYVDYFANNAGPVPGAPDQIIRIINTGFFGSPITSPVGDICANIYVFDNRQEMIACCAQRVTPNGLDSASVGTQLTNNPLTSVVPTAGVIKIVLQFPVPTGGCNPTNSAGTLTGLLGPVFGTHLQVTGGATFVTETEKQTKPLSVAEEAFLQQACSFVLYLGTGKGTCTSSVPGH